MKLQQEAIISPLNEKKIEIIPMAGENMGTYEMQEVIEESEEELDTQR